MATARQSLTLSLHQKRCIEVTYYQLQFTCIYFFGFLCLYCGNTFVFLFCFFCCFGPDNQNECKEVEEQIHEEVLKCKGFRKRIFVIIQNFKRFCSILSFFILVGWLFCIMLIHTQVYESYHWSKGIRIRGQSLHLRRRSYSRSNLKHVLKLTYPDFFTYLI